MSVTVLKQPDSALKHASSLAWRVSNIKKEEQKQAVNRAYHARPRLRS